MNTCQLVPYSNLVSAVACASGRTLVRQRSLSRSRWTLTLGFETGGMLRKAERLRLADSVRMTRKFTNG